MTESKDVLHSYDALTLALARAQSMIDVLRGFVASDGRDIDAELELRDGSLESFLFTVDDHLDAAKLAAAQVWEAWEGPASGETSQKGAQL